MDEFHNFKEKFLGKEGAFSAYKILIGYFYNFDYDGGVDGVPGAELKKRGFNYDVERDFDKFTNRIMDYDIVWIIASN